MRLVEFRIGGKETVQLPVVCGVCGFRLIKGSTGVAVCVPRPPLSDGYRGVGVAAVLPSPLDHWKCAAVSAMRGLVGTLLTCTQARTWNVLHALGC